MSTPKNESPILSVRLPADLIARVDDFAAAEQASAKGRKCSRTDAVRMLLLRGLDSLGRCAAVKGQHVCTMHTGHAGTHYDSHTDRSWK